MREYIRVKCINDVVVDSSETAFICGKVYNAIKTSNGTVVAENEQGNKSHYIKGTYDEEDKWFETYFRFPKEHSELPKYVKETLEYEEKNLRDGINRLQKVVDINRKILEDSLKELESAKQNLSDVECALYND